MSSSLAVIIAVIHVIVISNMVLTAIEGLLATCTGGQLDTRRFTKRATTLFLVVVAVSLRMAWVS